MAVNAKDQVVVSTAIERIHDEAALAGIALGDAGNFPIEKALERVTYADLLKQIADEAEKDWVRVAALTRLKKQNHNIDLLPYQELIKRCVRGGNTEAVSTAQRSLYALAESDDSEKLNLLKIGTVFQIFLINTLASGKKAEDLTKEDWADIAGKVTKYAVLEDGQSYSEFVFGLYADYIDLSEKALLARGVDGENAAAVKALADEIRRDGDLLHQGEITEVQYIEENLWLALEAMIKSLSLSLTPKIGPEFTTLVQSITQLGFEYGRYRMYAREQAILQEYLDRQGVLDEELKAEYEAYLADINRNAERFQGLIRSAFDPGLRESLKESVELARAYGVKDEEILKSEDEIDDFFL